MRSFGKTLSESQAQPRQDARRVPCYPRHSLLLGLAVAVMGCQKTGDSASGAGLDREPASAGKVALVFDAGIAPPISPTASSSSAPSASQRDAPVPAPSQSAAPKKSVGVTRGFPWPAGVPSNWAEDSR